MPGSALTESSLHKKVENTAQLKYSVSYLIQCLLVYIFQIIYSRHQITGVQGEWGPRTSVRGGNGPRTTCIMSPFACSRSVNFLQLTSPAILVPSILRMSKYPRDLNP